MANKYKTPVINSYELADISDLKVKIFKEYNEEWLDFIVHCRNGGEHNLEEYISGYIDKSTFLDMMKFNWNNNQISFHTVKALKRIKFISSEKIEK